jgi:hypothetical protein
MRLTMRLKFDCLMNCSIAIKGINKPLLRKNSMGDLLLFHRAAGRLPQTSRLKTMEEPGVVEENARLQAHRVWATRYWGRDLALEAARRDAEYRAIPPIIWKSRQGLVDRIFGPVFDYFIGSDQGHILHGGVDRGRFEVAHPAPK